METRRAITQEIRKVKKKKGNRLFLLITAILYGILIVLIFAEPAYAPELTKEFVCARYNICS